MNPSTPEQLARLLDQMSASYPNGIPREVIRFVAEAQQSEEPQVAAPRFHIFVVGDEGSLSDAARELLGGITSKGLKISSEEFTLAHASDDAVEALALSSASQHVIVFGKDGRVGWGDRSDGSAVLFAPSLDGLIGDAGLKKGLWRDLQALLQLR
ncbi:MAG: hypothetical protein RIS36_2297 [Pseudomonadota bacterium]|jgi:hypothetical protein